MSNTDQEVYDWLNLGIADQNGTQEEKFKEFDKQIGSVKNSVAIRKIKFINFPDLFFIKAHEKPSISDAFKDAKEIGFTYCELDNEKFQRFLQKNTNFDKLEILDLSHNNFTQMLSSDTENITKNLTYLNIYTIQLHLKRA